MQPFKHTHASDPSPVSLIATFGLAGPPVGFIALVVGASVFSEIPEGLGALAYGLHPLGMVLIYACGLAPALVTACVLVWLSDHALSDRLWFAGAVGFCVSLVYGTIGTAVLRLGLDYEGVLALGAIGGVAAVVSLAALQLVARSRRKSLEGARTAR
ncbi:MAG: hypothetical protein AAGJ70_00505 [Pseudomonadota bacterium]